MVRTRHFSLPRALVRSLVGELRFGKWRGAAKIIIIIIRERDGRSRKEFQGSKFQSNKRTTIKDVQKVGQVGDFQLNQKPELVISEASYSQDPAMDRYLG